MSPQKMTAKEALSVLHELYYRHSFFHALETAQEWEHAEVFLKRTGEAMYHLTSMIYGPPLKDEINSLCPQCHTHRITMDYLKQWRCPTCVRKEQEADVVVSDEPSSTSLDVVPTESVS